MNLHDFDIILNKNMGLEPLAPEDMLRYANPELEEPTEIETMNFNLGTGTDLIPMKKYFDIGVRES